MTSDLLFVDFVNSDWYDGAGNSKDVLAQPGWLDAFVQKWFSAEPAAADGDPADADAALGPLRPAPGAATSIDAQGMGLLRDLRATLRGVIETASQSEQPSARQVAALQRFLDAGALRYRVGQDADGAVAVGLDVRPDDAAAIAAAVALSAAEFLANGDLDRLKQCDNAGCRWVFYDASKNNSRRWCDSRLCGNVDKVRRYRERARAR